MMISYYRCTEVSEDLIFEAFNNGFSDYMIKLNLPKEAFFNRFFGAEGNSLQYSFVAADENKGVGLILGGIKEYEGFKTLRCGTLAVHPDYRGNKISYKLFELHKEEGIINGCKQLFLEVIKGNDRAISFYSKLGYEKVYDIFYFYMEDLSMLTEYSLVDAKIRKIDIKDIEEIAGRSKDIHINWQNDIDYLKATENMIYYGSYNQNQLIGSLGMQPNGKVSFLWTDRAFRGKGIASTLLKIACDHNKIKRINLSFPNNSLLYGFAKHIGFKKDTIAQYEMYLTL